MQNPDKKKARVGPFLDPSSGQPNSSPDFAANLLSDQYKSVFVEPRPEWVVEDVQQFFTADTVDQALSDIEFSEADIEHACQELSSSSAPGADDANAGLSTWSTAFPLLSLER